MGITSKATFKGIKEIKYPSEDMILRFGSKSRTGEIALDEGTGKFKFSPDLTVEAQVNLSTAYSSDSAEIVSDKGTNATLNRATTALAGVMAAADKVKLNDAITETEDYKIHYTNIDDQYPSFLYINNAYAVSNNDLMAHVFNIADSTGVAVGDTIRIYFKYMAESIVLYAESGWIDGVAGGTEYPTSNVGYIIEFQAESITGPGVYWKTHIINKDAGATDLSITHTTTNVGIDSSTGNDIVINAATTSAAGVMTSTDKVALNDLGSFKYRVKYTYMEQNLQSTLLVNRAYALINNDLTTAIFEIDTVNTVVKGDTIRILLRLITDSLDLHTDYGTIDGASTKSFTTADEGKIVELIADDISAPAVTWITSLIGTSPA